jgi:SAM-dependent methyltransferase
LALRATLLNLLRGPRCSKPLALRAFETDARSGPEEADVKEGSLFCDGCDKTYRVTHGVPVMLDEQTDGKWSFSAEWDAHFRSGLVRTWGWSVDQRVEQFFRETGTDANWCNGKLILDAGCGNGQLTERLSQLGATVIGLDYSTSVFTAERHRQSSHVHFVRGDLQAPPFQADTFDLIISNGVLHHTRRTYSTFIEVARLAKPGGRFYLWLYRRPETFAKRYCLYPATDLARRVVSRMPGRFEAAAVKVFTGALFAWHSVRGRARPLSWQERLIGAYDTLTPRWRHYHTPIEVANWFFRHGYSAPVLTHWDNPYGFGMLAMKHPQDKAPGVHFGHAFKQ